MSASLFDLMETTPKAGLKAPIDGRMWRVITSWRVPPNRNIMLGEFTNARSRKLHFDLFGPATAECSVDGRTQQASTLQELSQDLSFYRFNPVTGAYDCWFTGPIGRTLDTLSETVHTISVNATDYRAMLGRSIKNVGHTYTQTDQAAIVSDLVYPFRTAATMPWDQGIVYYGATAPDGGTLPTPNATGVLRDRTYVGNEKIGKVIDDLAACINGFDWGCEPISGTSNPPSSTYLRIWYPQRGVVKTFVAEYGVNVSSLTRSVDSTDFANWDRFDGQPAADGTPVFAIGQPTDVITNPGGHPEGFWQDQQSAADVSVDTTLQQQADGYLAYHSRLVPSYTIKLIPGAWVSKADCWLGDTIELRIKSGRLNVDTAIRILGVDVDINDNGQETISLIVGRSDVTFGDVIADQQHRLDALSRR